MRAGSLFSGIGGFDLGMERAGFEIAWQVENDPFCNEVLKKHWPDVPRFGDIQEVSTNELSTIDLLFGGFPCQDVSGIGRKTGIEGERSGLWREFFRLIRDLRPDYVCVENVPGLLVRGMSRVLSDLATIRYDAEWEIVSAATAVVAPHQRERLFIVAYPSSQRLEAPRVFKGKLFPESQYISRRLDRGNDKKLRALPPSGVFGVDDGLSIDLDRVRVLGNAILPSVAEIIGKKIIEHKNLRYGT